MITGFHSAQISTCFLAANLSGYRNNFTIIMGGNTLLPILNQTDVYVAYDLYCDDGVNDGDDGGDDGGDDNASLHLLMIPLLLFHLLYMTKNFRKKKSSYFQMS